jgi:hypothetical protein
MKWTIWLEAMTGWGEVDGEAVSITLLCWRPRRTTSGCPSQRRNRWLPDCRRRWLDPHSIPMENGRPTSIGIGGRHQAGFTGDFVGMRRCDQSAPLFLGHHPYAALAEKERSLIAERTRAALDAKRPRARCSATGSIWRKPVRWATRPNRKAADDFARNVLPMVGQIQAAGIRSVRGVAKALNDRGIRTARGGAWHNSTVRNLLAGA